MMALPWGVRMDSGWNCTPSVGWVACRRPIGIPPGPRAVTFRSRGSVSSATISEWYAVCPGAQQRDRVRIVPDEPQSVSGAQVPVQRMARHLEQSRHWNTSVRLPSSSTLFSVCHWTARASARHSLSRPT
jgi:hypothetical protein